MKGYMAFLVGCAFLVFCLTQEKFWMKIIGKPAEPVIYEKWKPSPEYNFRVVSVEDLSLNLIKQGINTKPRPDGNYPGGPWQYP